MICDRLSLISVIAFIEVERVRERSRLWRTKAAAVCLASSTVQLEHLAERHRAKLKSPKRKMSIIKKSFYLAEIYTSRVLYFECMSTKSYESSRFEDYDAIKKSVISLQNQRKKCIYFQAFICTHFSFRGL